MKNDDCCVICLERMDLSCEKITKTTCGHYFHERCLIEWYRKGNTYCTLCPICRQFDYIDEEFKVPSIRKIIIGNVYRMFKLTI